MAAACGDDGNVNKLPDAPTTDGPIDTPPPLPGMLRLAPTTANFGSVVVGDESVAMAITVENVGEGPTGTISAAISGAMGSNFEVDSTNCNVLEAAATCTIQVKFTPGSAGMKSAALAVTASPGGSLQTTLDGIGLRPGDLTINPSTHGFGSVVTGATSASQTFTVTNPGGVASGTLTTTVGGANPGEFTKTSDTCNGTAVAPAGTCAITVQFAPQSAGPKGASFTITGLPGGAVVAAVSGVGLNPPQLFVNPPSQSFGTVLVNATSSISTFNVVNTGGVATTAISQTLSGADAGDFTIVTSTCVGTVLPPSGSCTLSVRFQPLSIGPKSASVLLSAALGGSLEVDLSGTGIEPGQITITPSAHAFANTIIGTTATAQTFTVENTGGVATGSLVTSLNGNDAAQFAITANTCSGASLPGLGTCTVSVVFAPGSPGTKAASLRVTGSPGGTAQASLSGNAFPGASLSISPSSRDFGSVGVGSMSSFLTFTVQNLGGTPSGDPGITLAGTNPSQFSVNDDCVVGLAPLATCTISVRFEPSAIGNFSATVSATAAPGGAVSATVFGQGVNAASLSVNPSNLQYPTTLIGDVSQSLSFLVTNNGGTTTGALTVGKAGPAAGEYNVVTSTCTTLAPQASCLVTINFQPTTRGTRNATISVGGSPGGIVTVAVSGDALPRLEIIEVDFDVPVSPYDFGTVSIGGFEYVNLVIRNNTSQDHPLDLANDFGIPQQFGIDYISCGGKGGKDQLVAHGGKQPVIFAQDVCFFWFYFAPTSQGAKFGETVFSIGPTAFDRVTQQFTGNGVNGLSIAPVTQPPGFPAPTSDFGNVAIGATSPSLVFRVTNAGDGVTTGALDTAALQVQRFQIVNDGCEGVMLFPGGSCDIAVSFTPTLLGLDQTVLAVSASPGGPASINIRGTGVDPSLLIFNPTPLAFGDVFAGQTKVLTLTVTNPAGAQTSGPLSFALQNDSCGFGYGSDCFDILFVPGDCQDGVTVLTGGQSCTIHVEFDSTGGPVSGCASGKCGGPSLFGPKYAEIAFDATPGTNGTVIVDVTANTVSTISITPSFHNFGAVAPEATPSHVFTVRNDSPSPVTIIQTSFSGDSTGLQVNTSTCATLVSQGTCQITVGFVPDGSVDLDARLDVIATNGYGVAIAELAGSRDLPSSCLAILTANPAAGSGQYHIDAQDNGAGALVTCDMVTDGGGYTAFPLVGATTSRNTDFNSCLSYGMDIVVPRTYAHAANLVGTFGMGYFMAVPGVYGTVGGQSYVGCPMMSSSSCAADWDSVAGDPWFVRNDANYTEPNNDYTAGCWLGAFGFDALGFQFNDLNCGYSTSSYVCSTNDKLGGTPPP